MTLQGFPWLTLILIAIQAAAYLLMRPDNGLLLPGRDRIGLDLDHISLASVLGHSFVSASLPEVIFHGIFTYQILRVLEGRTGWPKCLLIFVVGAAVNAGLHLALSTVVTPSFLLLGPGGGLAAAIGASLAIFPYAKTEHWLRSGHFSFRYFTIEIPFWLSAPIYLLMLSIVGVFGALSVTPLLLVKVGAFAAGFLAAKLLGFKAYSPEASDAEAAMADGEDYSTLDRSALFALAESQTENPRITLALISRLISDRFQPDAILKKRFADHIPLFEKDVEMALSAGSILVSLKDSSGLTMEQSLRVAMAADAKSGAAAAKQIFDWVLHSSESDDDEKETAAFRLAEVLEREGNSAGARDLYAWLVKTYPFGSVTAASQSRLSALQQLP